MRPNSSIIKSWLNEPDLYSQKKLNAFKSINNQADKNALSLFRQASKRIPAYKDFLKKHKIKPGLIKNIKDFDNVPQTTKTNYITEYSLSDRCWDGEIVDAHMVATSSGTTGKSHYWPRGVQQEIAGAEIHDLIFNSIFNTKDQTTLFVNAFSLGNWIAGMYTQACVYLLNLKSHNLTLTNPGYSQEDTIKVVKELSEHHQQTVIAGHPPMLKMILEYGVEHHINWKKRNVKLLTAGEGFSENWRDYVLGIMGQKNHSSIISIYGSADAGLMGFESPNTIALKRKTSTNPLLNKDIFSNERNPYIYQYDPRFKYLQCINSEITITADATMPLIKYNIHDHGDILKPSQVDKHLDKVGWQLPYVYIFGRSTINTTIFGLNIYPENVKAVLEHKSLQSTVTGKFKIETKFDSKQDQYLDLIVELKKGLKPSDKINNQIKKMFVEVVIGLNSEYNKAESVLGKKVHPLVNSVKFESPHHFPKNKMLKLA